MSTPQNEWRMCGQASTNTNDDSFDLAYSGTWLTGAQNPAVRPPGLTKTNSNGHFTKNWGTRHAAQLNIDEDGVRMRFLVSNDENEFVNARIWLWDANGSPMDALYFNPVTAGPTLCNVNPATNQALSLFFYADTITATTDNLNKTTLTQLGSTNGIAEIRFDARGATWMYADFDIDVNSGTGADAICLFKGYGNN